MKSTRTTPPNQLLIDWSISAEARTAAPEIRPTADSAALAAVALPYVSGSKHSDVRSTALTFRNPELLQVLPWDFRTSFPQPMEEAILNGRLEPEDAEPENVASLHAEHARHAMILLDDLERVMDARRSGVDPRDGKSPRTTKQREALEKLFKEEPGRLEHAFETLIDIYEEVFGPEAADAFRKAIRAWRAGVEVIGEAPPMAPALPASIEAGIFGKEEDGTAVDPSDEEVAEITERVADAMIDRPSEAERERLLEKFGEDFGQKSAEEIDRWSRLKPEADETGSSEYDPGHPWHYYDQGDGAEPLPLDAIPARPVGTEHFNVKWPKLAAKRRQMMEKLLAGQRVQLAEDEQRYRCLLQDGVAALSRYDKEIAHGGNDELAWASAVALKYNHVSGARGRILWLEQQLGVPHEMTRPTEETPHSSSIRALGS